MKQLSPNREMPNSPTQQNNTSTFGSASAPSSTPSLFAKPAFAFGKPALNTDPFTKPTSLFGSTTATPFHDTSSLFAMATAIYNNVFATSFDDKERALGYFRQAGSLGHVEAQCKVGDLYREGYGAPRDFDRAFEWYTKAAANGDVLAKLNLGIMCEEGQGRILKDYKEAYIYYLQAAERNNTEATYRLGHLYQNGLGVQRDATQALLYYERAAKQGHILGAYNAGYMYQFGLGRNSTSLFGSPPINYGKAFTYYMQAAEKDYPDALCNVGYLFEKGQGVMLNYEKAFQYYTRGAEKGSNQANQNLGELYMDGKGTSVDLEKAYHHFNIARKGGIKESQEYINILEERRNGDSIKFYHNDGTNSSSHITLEEHYRVVKEKDKRIAVLMEQMKMQQTQIDSLMGKLFTA
ncbi:hypothetical protein INT46_006959 [Mucor plumbeus]|uniref:Uncharacterized protein n=1 Tax=Mucor plumbeus TaxID=97098 RepID=A0A8H7V9Q9_9FUNG|nr:hypothetical protein INT46_006959 [Mucor plumbeus]